MVERRTPNPSAGGSSPSWPANHLRSKAQRTSGRLTMSALSFRFFRRIMGRLLKKKDPGLKKKRAPGEDAGLSRDGSGVGVSAFAGSGTIAAARSGGQSKNVSASKNTVGSVALKVKYVDQALQFLREVKVELKKVVWPSRKQTVASTVVVIVLVLLVSLFLGIVDLGLSSLIKVVLS